MSSPLLQALAHTLTTLASMQTEAVSLVATTHLAFTCMPGESNADHLGLCGCICATFVQRQLTPIVCCTTVQTEHSRGPPCWQYKGESRQPSLRSEGDAALSTKPCITQAPQRTPMSSADRGEEEKEEEKNELCFCPAGRRRCA